MAKEQKYGLRDLERQFPDDASCLEFIFDALHSRKCSCGGKYSPLSGRKQYQCSKCRFQIAPCANTIFHKSDTPLTLWFHAIWIFSNAKSGISAKEMERQLNVTYKCAYRILKQIREALKQESDFLKGIVETDSAHLGGRFKAGKGNKGQKEALAAKTIVMAAAERGGRMRAKVRPNRSAKQIADFVRENIEEKSFLMTDAANTYTHAAKGYDHFSVNHKKGEYARGPFHINNIEAWFSHIKRSIKGTFKSVSREQLQSYLDAFVFHYNHRTDNRQRFSALLGAVLQS